MKITTQTVDRMVLKIDTFSVIMNFLFPLIFVAVGVVFVSASIQSESTGYLPVAVVLLVAGVLYALFNRYQTILLFDKQLGKIIETKKRLVMSRSKEYNINNVERVELRKKWRTVESPNRQQGFSISRSQQVLDLRIVLVFKDNSDLLIDTFMEGSNNNNINGLSIPSTGKETKNAVDLANSISQFLNIPLQELQQ